MDFQDMEVACVHTCLLLRSKCGYRYIQYSIYVHNIYIYIHIYIYTKYTLYLYL